MTKQELSVCIDVYPGPDTDVFRIGAADDILRLLADANETEFTIPELVDATGVTRSTVWRAVDLLDSISAIRIRKTPQRNHIAIDPSRLQKDDPILAIQQSEFHAPIRAFVDRVQPRSLTLTTSTSFSVSSFSGASLGARLTVRATLIASSSSMATGQQPADGSPMSLLTSSLTASTVTGSRSNRMWNPPRAHAEPGQNFATSSRRASRCAVATILTHSEKRSSSMSSTRIEQLIHDAQAAFDRRPTDIETGLDVKNAALLQLRKACRLLAGAEALQDASYYTLVIEASFVAIERTVEFRLLERSTMQPDDLPGTHPAVYREAAAAGVFAESTAADLADLWRDHRAKTYYQDGLASAARADAMHELATEVHAYITGRSRQGHECLCGETG